MAQRTHPIPPLRKQVVVAWDQERAFRRFTSEMASWWPLRSHSVGQADAESVTFEGRVGGRIVEHIRGGHESVWGTVTHWDPPRRVGFTWHPSRTPDTAGSIEVTFHPDASGTRVTLVHSGWEALGDLGRKARSGYSIGWAGVLAIYAGRRRVPVVLLTQGLSWLATLVARFRRKVPGPVPSGVNGA
jgi:hypothetical protein